MALDLPKECNRLLRVNLESVRPNGCVELKWEKRESKTSGEKSEGKSSWSTSRAATFAEVSTHLCQ